jgi:hypothetical protein
MIRGVREPRFDCSCICGECDDLQRIPVLLRFTRHTSITVLKSLNGSCRNSDSLCLCEVATELVRNLRRTSSFKGSVIPSSSFMLKRAG